MHAGHADSQASRTIDIILLLIKTPTALTITPVTTPDSRNVDEVVTLTDNRAFASVTNALDRQPQTEQTLPAPNKVEPPYDYHLVERTMIIYKRRPWTR